MTTLEREAGRAVSATARGTDVAKMLPIEDFLVVVGCRVRRHRALVHMSRRQLAERSGVSERYLAQLEGGHGNMSITLLRRVALALALPLPELVAEDDAESFRSSR